MMKSDATRSRAKTPTAFWSRALVKSLPVTSSAAMETHTLSADSTDPRTRALTPARPVCAWGVGMVTMDGLRRRDPAFGPGQYVYDWGTLLKSTLPRSMALPHTPSSAV